MRHCFVCAADKALAIRLRALLCRQGWSMPWGRLYNKDGVQIRLLPKTGKVGLISEWVVVVAPDKREVNICQHELYNILRGGFDALKLWMMERHVDSVLEEGQVAL